MGTKFPFCKMKNVLQIDGGVIVAKKVWMYIMLFKCTVKMIKIVNLRIGIVYHHFLRREKHFY